MFIKTVNIMDIKENKYNPRVKLEKNTKEYQQIAESIKEFGFVEPLVINECNMCCIGGHQRLQVLKDIGVKEVECVLVYEPDLQREKALCIALNKIKGDWDIEKLTYLLKDSEINSFFTGFEQQEIEEYLKDTDEVLSEMEKNEWEQGKECDTVVRIGDFSFVIKSCEYDALLDDIREHGIFEPEKIKQELKRRICND